MKIELPKSPPKEIEREVETMRRNHSKIVQNIGKFVLIQGDTVVAYSRSLSEALAKGYNQFGLGNFLVKEISEDPPVCAMRCGVIPTDGEVRLTKIKKNVSLT